MCIWAPFYFSLFLSKWCSSSQCFGLFLNWSIQASLKKAGTIIEWFKAGPGFNFTSIPFWWPFQCLLQIILNVLGHQCFSKKAMTMCNAWHTPLIVHTLPNPPKTQILWSFWSKIPISISNCWLVLSFEEREMWWSTIKLPQSLSTIKLSLLIVLLF